MSKSVSKSQFKPHALRHFREVERTGRELIITDRGRPVLKLVRYSADPAQVLKELRGSVIKYEKPTDPVAQKDWEALR